jgi:glycosyltransferase involved in cell wall biosynthesis
VAAISVVVPVYNGGAYLRACLESLLGQSFSDIEIIALDDGSTDESLAILQGFRDPRLRVYSHENRGLAATRNRGIELASTSLVARSDQDDVSVPNRLLNQLQILQAHSDAVAVFSRHYTFGRRHRWNNPDKQNAASGIQTYSWQSHGVLLASTMLCRRDVSLEIGGYREAYYPADDLDMLFRLSEVGTVLVDPDMLVGYRMSDEASTFKTFNRMQVRHRDVMASRDARLNGAEEPAPTKIDEHPDLTPRDLSRLRIRQAGADVLNGHYLRASRGIVGAVAADPRSVVDRAKRIIIGRWSR